MPRITEFALIDRAEQPCVAVKERTPVAQLPALIGSAFPKLGAYVAGEGLEPAGIPYVRFLDMGDMDNLLVEVGFPLARPLPGAGDVVAGSIPAGRYVTFMFLGPNEDMEPVYQEMEAWLAQRGLVSSGQCIEQYYNGAPFPREQALTGVLVLLV